MMIARLIVAFFAASALAAAAGMASAQSCQAVTPNRTVCKMVLNSVQTLTIEGDGQADRVGRGPFKARLLLDIDGIRCLDQTHSAWLFGRRLRLAGRCRMKFIEGEHAIAATLDVTGGAAQSVGAKVFRPDRLSALPIGPLQ